MSDLVVPFSVARVRGPVAGLKGGGVSRQRQVLLGADPGKVHALVETQGAQAGASTRPERPRRLRCDFL